MLYWKDEKDHGKIASRLEKVREICANADEKDFNDSESVKSLIWNFAEEEGRGFVLWPLRVALSGRERSPDPFTLASILGKDETVARIDAAVTLLK